MVDTTTAETVPLTSEAHQLDFWTRSEADRRFKASYQIREQNGLSSRFVEMGGGVFDEDYLEALRTIQHGMDYQVNFHIAAQAMHSFTRSIGSAALHEEMSNAYDAAVEAKRGRVNKAIRAVGNVYVRITNYKTLAVDSAQRSAYFNLDDDAQRPRYNEVQWDHPGQRVGRLVTLEAIDKDYYFGLVVKGKSGASYSLGHPAGNTQVLVQRNRALLVKPTFPIKQAK